MNAKYLFRLRDGRPPLKLHVPLKSGVKVVETKPDGEWYETPFYADACRLATEESVELKSPEVEKPVVEQPVEEVAADQDNASKKTFNKPAARRGDN